MRTRRRRFRQRYDLKLTGLQFWAALMLLGDAWETGDHMAYTQARKAIRESWESQTPNA